MQTAKATRPKGLILTWLGLVVFGGAPAAFAQNDTPSVQVSFSGWGNQGTIKTRTLSFSGFGGDMHIKSGLVSFTGRPGSKTTHVNALQFTGWGDAGETEGGTVTFQGWSIGTSIKTGAINFTGWSSPDHVEAGGINFQGCGDIEKKPLQISLNEEFPKSTLPISEPTQVLPMEGNWIVKWEGAKRNGAFATLTKNLKWECVIKEDGCWYSFTRNDKKDWTVAMTIPGLFSSGGSASFSGEDRISVKYQSGIFGDWEAQSTGIVTDDKITGIWTYGENSGTDIWTRVRSDISFVQANDGNRIPYGTPLSLSAPYSGPGNDMRGNRPWQKISIFGDNLWGLHRWWIPRESGIEITGISYRCRDGNFFGFYGNYDMCLKNDGVRSIDFILTFWSQAKPGLHFLYFDDKAIPFNLELPGYPDKVLCG